MTRGLIACLRPYVGRVAVGLACLLAVDAVQMVGPRLVGRAFDRLRAGDASGIGGYALALLAVGIVAGALRFGWRYGLIGASRRLRRDLRQRLYERLAGMPEDAFARRPIGALLSLASSDVEAVQQACGFGLLAAADALFLVAFATAMLLSISPILTVAALAPLPLIAVSAAIGGRAIQRRSTAVQESAAAWSERVRETLAGARVVKAHAREAAFLDALGASSARQLDDQLALARPSALFEPLPGLIAGTSVVIVVWCGVPLVRGHALSLGDFVAFTGYLGLLAWPMNAVGMVINLSRRGGAALERLRAVLDAPPAADPVDAAPLPADDRLAAHGLGFSYPGATRPALVDVGFDLPAGATLGVVGATASGKSTFALLLPRVHEPPVGTLRLGGVDLRALRLGDLRRIVALAPQEPVLFSTTVRDNIDFGSGLDDARLAEVAALAGVAGDIAALPGGWATPVGERGVTLSGGQRQRIGIARALARDPRLLVLDDALSAVDARTEALVLGNLRRARAGRSTVIIAHRASAVRHADLILVLDHGRVVERGTHEALVAAGGWYARLARLQRAAGEADERP